MTNLGTRARRRRLWTVLLLLPLLGSCQRPAYERPQPLEPVADTRPTLSLWELAARLRMTIDANDTLSVTLSDAEHTVVLFTHAGAEFYVNGRAAGRVGPAERRKGVLYLDPGLAERIAAQIGRVAESGLPPRGRTRRPIRDKGTIVIDAGHGGKDPGATSVLGFVEKTVNLSVAQRVASGLEALGYRVVMTRDRDVFISLERRWQLANDLRPRLFVSIHADSSPTPDAQGFTVYIAEGASPQSRRAAECLEDSLAQSGRPGRGIRPAGFQVLIHTTCPAVLIEMGYLTHWQEADRLRDPTVQRQIAEAIVAGIECY